VDTETRCRYCSVVSKITFWGPRPQAHWKRPVLLALSIIGLCGFGAVLWLFRDRWMPLGRQDLVLTLGAMLVLLSALGAAVSLNECNACILRLIGNLEPTLGAAVRAKVARHMREEYFAHMARDPMRRLAAQAHR
jgi:hypothetical protein